ncbi:MAG: deoxyribose-phosphate aldolase [Prevotellaceae bacterium]|nr:deoxyribose-phosphate aldolase [Prevotellaceae bacterium]
MNKFNQLFNQYDFSIKNKDLSLEVEKALVGRYTENKEKSVYAKLLGLIDVTSLNTDDTVEKIVSLTQKMNDFDDTFEILPHPAAICVYPNFVPVVKDTLSENVEIAAVAGGFPHAQTFIEVKIAEVAMAVMEGATEIDTVIPFNALFSGNFEETYGEISEIKAACRGAKLKVILETGLIQDAEMIKKAAIIAMAAGADFIKTSTGKIACGATLEAAYVICDTIKEFNAKNGVKIGFKAAGGISETDDAVKYYTLVESMLGKEYLSPALFRIGASRLTNNLLTEIEGKEVRYF